jgi:DNA-binding MarR family transcriptional regulator
VTDLAQTFHDLVRVETVLWNSIDARLRAQYDLTLARFETMQVLARSGPCRVSDIAGDLAIGWAGASKIVDRVEAAGHCRRSANPGDRRSSLITLTPRGRALLRRATIGFTALLQERLAGALSPTQLEQLGRSLSLLCTASAVGHTAEVGGAPPTG